MVCVCNGKISINKIKKLSKFRYPRRKQLGISAKFPPSATDNFSLFKSSAASCGVLNPDLKITKTHPLNPPPQKTL